MNDFLSEFLEGKESEKSLARTQKRMRLAIKIEDARKAKNLSKGELAKKMGHNSPSIVTRWISGTHNFTTDTLFDLEPILGIELVNTDLKPRHVQTVILTVTSDEYQPLQSFAKTLMGSSPQPDWQAYSGKSNIYFNTPGN